MLFDIDNKAQSGAVFRLLIDSVIGLVILLLILSALTYFQSLNVQTSQLKVFSTVKTATETPNGEIVSSEDLAIMEGMGFFTHDFAEKTGYKKDCFELQSSLPIAEIRNDEYIEFKSNINTKVYAKCAPTGNTCGPSSSSDCCEIECIVSFESKPN